MELSIKDLDRILETLDKFHDTLFSIDNHLNLISTSLFSVADSHTNNSIYEISNSLVTIKEFLQGKFSENILHYEGEHFIDRIKKEFFDEKK